METSALTHTLSPPSSADRTTSSYRMMAPAWFSVLTLQLHKVCPEALWPPHSIVGWSCR